LNKTLLLILLFLLILSGCTSPQATQEQISIKVLSDGQTIPVQLPAGSTAQQALDSAGLSLNALDRTIPTAYTVLSQGATVRIVRVNEAFEIDQVVIPFEQQTLRNESLPLDKEILVQAGENGLQEITYRRVYEDGVEISSQPIAVKSVILKAPVPEIRMLGVQAPFSPLAIPGRLIYLRDGNAWMMERTTGNRQALITTGDLDGRVFSLSSDGAWLLFTRRSEAKDQINELWAARITLEGGSSPTEAQELVDLDVNNVIHFADWVPGSTEKIIFSTVEPREAAPGWQANNDLQVLTFSDTGWTTKWTTIVEANSGGIYGWWGTQYGWLPDDINLIFNRPDSIGIVNYKTGEIKNLVEVLPLQTRRDWAWVPGVTWGPDGQVLFYNNHTAPAGSTSPEESQLFDLTAVPLQGGPAIQLVSQTGMFAYPLASPTLTNAAGAAGYEVAFLQAIFPEQSENSRYRLAVMDRDGSNRRVLFPAEGTPGLEPQLHWGAWSPAPLPESEQYAIAVLYQGNLWMVNTISGEAAQITGDGLTTRVIWN
jgi:hypothetical protein